MLESWFPEDKAICRLKSISCQKFQSPMFTPLVHTGKKSHSPSCITRREAMAESKLDSESWGIVYSHLSTQEVLRLNVVSKTTKILLERGVLSPIKVKH